MHRKGDITYLGDFPVWLRVTLMTPDGLNKTPKNKRQDSTTVSERTGEAKRYTGREEWSPAVCGTRFKPISPGNGSALFTTVTRQAPLAVEKVLLEQCGYRSSSSTSILRLESCKPDLSEFPTLCAVWREVTLFLFIRFALCYTV